MNTLIQGCKFQHQQELDKKYEYMCNIREWWRLR